MVGKDWAPGLTWAENAWGSWALCASTHGTIPPFARPLNVPCGWPGDPESGRTVGGRWETLQNWVDHDLKLSILGSIDGWHIFHFTPLLCRFPKLWWRLGTWETWRAQDEDKYTWYSEHPFTSYLNSDQVSRVLNRSQLTGLILLSMAMRVWFSNLKQTLNPTHPTPVKEKGCFWTKVRTRIITSLIFPPMLGTVTPHMIWLLKMIQY